MAGRGVRVSVGLDVGGLVAVVVGEAAGPLSAEQLTVSTAKIVRDTALSKTGTRTVIRCWPPAVK